MTFIQPICDLDLGLLITRTELGLADLDLNDGTVYVMALDGIRPRGESWRREFARSPNVPGQRVVHAVLEADPLQVDVICKGDTWFDAHQNYETAVDAFRQTTFNVTETVDGVTHLWQCTEADVVPVWRAIWQAVPAIAVAFEAPRQPVDVDSGS